MLNRCALTIKAKKPFLSWLKSLPDPCDMTLDQVNSETSVYLLPDYTFDNQQEEILAHYFDLVFEEQLAAWWTAEENWPEDRSLKVFKKWFDVEFHSMVFDLVDAPLKKD
jgi:hypothetical protein